MLQNANKIPNSFAILHRRSLCGLSRLSLSGEFYGRGNIGRLRPNKFVRPNHYRLYSDKPGFEKSRSGFGFKTMFGLVGVGTAAVVAYAKYDPDFRRLIHDYVPQFDDFIKVTTLEDKSFTEAFDGVLNYITDLIPLSIGGGEDDKSKPSRETSPLPNLSLPPSPPSTAPKSAAPREAPKPLHQSTLDAGARKKGEEKGADMRLAPPPLTPLSVPRTESPVPLAASTSKPEVPPRNMVELEIRLSTASKQSADSFSNAVIALKAHGEEVAKLLETHVDRAEPALLASLKKKTEEKDRLVLAAEAAARDAETVIQKLKDIMDDPGFTASESVKGKTRSNIENVLKGIEKARRELRAERERSYVSDRYWHKVEQARSHFKEEIAAIFPHINIDEKQLTINPGDLDLFLAHAYHHVLFYQKELAKLETIGEHRIKQALQNSGENTSEKLINARVAQEVDKEKKLLVEDLQKKVLQARADAARELKSQMKLQMEVSDDHLADALRAKEIEVLRRSERLAEETVAGEKHNYKVKLAEMTGRLKGLEEAVTKRAEAQRQSEQAHVLFSACQSLFRALRNGLPGVHWSKGLRPLAPEIGAVASASSGKDPLIETVLQTIPLEAKDRGVYPEVALRERFLKVEQVARRVALVSEEGSSLPRYFMSYLQSLLLFRPVSPIPANELSDEPCDLNVLDNFDILQRARYWVDRGEFSMSLRYMNLLTGAPRKVSSDWMNETRIYLETQQAANVLLSHAGSVGLQYF